MLDLTRRGFLKGAGGALVASFLPLRAIEKLHWTSDEDLIRMAAKKRGLAFQSLLVDELPGTGCRYEATPVSLALRFNSPSVQLIREPSIKDIVKQRKYDGPRTFGPDWPCLSAEIDAFPVVFTSIEEDPQKAIESILKAHDIAFIDMLHHICRMENRVISIGDGFSVSAINTSFGQVEQHDLCIARVLMHPDTFIYLMKYAGEAVFDFNRQMFEEASEASFPWPVGHLWTAEMIVSDLIPPKTIFTIAGAEYIGVVSVPPPSRYGKLVKESWGNYNAPIVHNGRHFALATGMAMINDYTVSCIELTKDDARYRNYISQKERREAAQRAAWDAHCREAAKRGIFYKSGTVKPNPVG